MSKNIPLIRVASIAPMHRWLVERGRDPVSFLERAGIGWASLDDPLLPIPLCGAVQLLAEIALSEGPDAPYRIAKEHGGFEIGFIGAAALRGPSLRAGFQRLSRQMPLHSTHEIFTVRTDQAGINISDGWTLILGDDEILHYVQQYVAALVDMISSTATGKAPGLARVSLVPHPQTGVSHLQSWLGSRVIGSHDRILDVVIDKSLADMTISEDVRTRASANAVAKVRPLKQGNKLSDDVAILLSSMLPRTKTSADAIASIAGMSGRTFRRYLNAEGVNFSELVDQTRASIAIRRLQSSDPPRLGELAMELGYANQETLTRAVRRWTGNTPSRLASKGKNGWKR